jgi:phosphorylcholine metabolism protein LicD
MKKLFSYLLLFISLVAPLTAEEADEVEVISPSTSITREILQPLGMPVVSVWHSMRESLLLNYARQDAEGVEALGDWILTPYRYLLGGSDVTLSESGYAITPSSNYRKYNGLKTTLSLIALPVSATLGPIIKKIGLFFPSSKTSYKQFKAWKRSSPLISYHSTYKNQGISSFFSDDLAPCLHLARPSTISKAHLIELEAFQEVCTLLKKHDIVFWLDCGSALGAHRYQGMIPWDDDIDISIIASDHHNVKKLLSTLSPKKYQIQDWSSHLYPYTFLKLYIKKTKTLIDIYHYTLDPVKKEATYFYTYKDTPFPKQWKRSEEVMTDPIPYAVIFPLKRASFDGIEVWVPHDLEQFLHYKYGKDLSPTMVWNEHKQSYLKVKNHPYWKSISVD